MNNTDNMTRSMPVMGKVAPPDVLRMSHDCCADVIELLSALGMHFVRLEGQTRIPGSYWGDEEAGLIGNRLLARDDTPVHSVLHEACHYLCMDSGRREFLHTNAGGDYDEENAVCYLQVLLSDKIEVMGRERMFADMDRWGYSFRLGSAKRWFEHDAADARQWLVGRGLVAKDGRLNLPHAHGAGV